MSTKNRKSTEDRQLHKCKNKIHAYMIHKPMQHPRIPYTVIHITLEGCIDQKKQQHYTWWTNQIIFMPHKTSKVLPFPSVIWKVLYLRRNPKNHQGWVDRTKAQRTYQAKLITWNFMSNIGLIPHCKVFCVCPFTWQRTGSWQFWTHKS